MPLTTRAVSSRCYPKTFSKAAALARKPSKFTDPAVERIAYRGHPHAILDADVYAENAGRAERRKASVQEHVKLLKLMESGAPADEIEAYARQHKENALLYRHELK